MNFLFERDEVMSLINLVGNCNFDNLCSKPQCYAVSEAFSISTNTAAEDILFLKFKVALSVTVGIGVTRTETNLAYMKQVSFFGLTFSNS
jgi:hypothetical protein